MVPLYAARVQDLGPEDVAVFECGAYGHTAELSAERCYCMGWAEAHRQGSRPLERRLRCRLCHARGNRAVVSIRWRPSPAGCDEPPQSNRAGRASRKRSRARSGFRTLQQTVRPGFHGSNWAGREGIDRLYLSRELCTRMSTRLTVRRHRGPRGCRNSLARNGGVLALTLEFVRKMGSRHRWTSPRGVEG